MRLLYCFFLLWGTWPHCVPSILLGMVYHYYLLILFLEFVEATQGPSNGDFISVETRVVANFFKRNCFTNMSRCQNYIYSLDLFRDFTSCLRSIVSTLSTSPFPFPSGCSPSTVAAPQEPSSFPVVALCIFSIAWFIGGRKEQICPMSLELVCCTWTSLKEGTDRRSCVSVRPPSCTSMSNSPPELRSESYSLHPMLPRGAPFPLLL